MHDAQLISNGELSSSGHQVTDLIVELRDSPNHDNWHFTPCNRHVRCKYFRFTFTFILFWPILKPLN